MRDAAGAAVRPGVDVAALVGPLAPRLAHLDRLDPLASRHDAACAAPAAGALDCDVALLGGGLSLAYAPLLARRGLRVVVVERARAGAVHREWNASWDELQALVHSGLVDDAQLRALVLARYRHGVCRWHGGGAHVVRGVLDCAVDAAALLARCRAEAAAAGVRFYDGHAVVALGAGPHGVGLRLQGPAGEVPLTAGVVLDGRGVASPYATADLICPTVGGVLTGLEQGPGDAQLDPGVGEILATTEGTEDGRQHLWECFPGRPGEATVYLFYYSPRAALRPGCLAALYGRFARLLGRYKRGAARLVRPTFGLIPGWSRLTPAPCAPHPRVVLLGDAAARHSPLTFCGFGALLRSLRPAADAIVAQVARPRRRLTCADDRPLHSGTGALAQLLATPPPGDATNALLDAAFATLAGMGNDSYAALLQDRMSLGGFGRFLWRTSQRHPAVYPLVRSSLGGRRLAAWAGRSVGAATAASWRRRAARRRSTQGPKNSPYGAAPVR